MNIVESLEPNYIHQLENLYKETWFTQNRSLNDIETMLRNSYLTLGFIESDQLIGFCRVISDGVFKAFLFDVIVKQSFQNQGFGTLILDTVLKHHKINNIQHIELYCPNDISPFYEKLGFVNRSSILMRYVKPFGDNK